jgi:autotransporter translocation and assembly factor TamB
VLRRDGGELWLDGVTGTGAYGEEDDLELTLRIRSWPAPDIARALQWDVDLQGLVTAEASSRGRRSAPEGTARFTSAEGRYNGLPFRDLDVRAVVTAAGTQVKAGRARVGGGEVSFRGSLSDDGAYDASAEVSELEVGELAPSVAPDLRWGGKLSGQVVVQGTRERPRLQARLKAPQLTFGGELQTDAPGRRGDGTSHRGASAREARLCRRAGRRAPLRVRELSVEMRQTSLDPR